jgi:WD40 repeat protein
MGLYSLYLKKVVIGDASDSGLLTVFDSNLTIINSFKAHNDYIWKILFVSEFNSIITVSNDNTVKVWSTSNWSLVLTYKGHSAGVTSLQYFGDSMIASGSGDHTIHIWNLISGNKTGYNALLYNFTGE